jgi:hypothetical protein
MAGQELELARSGPGRHRERADETGKEGDTTEPHPLEMVAGRNDRLPVPAVVALWAMFGLVAVEIVVTYSRVPPTRLYAVSGSGVGAGFGRALVFLDFPVALAALPVIALAAERLRRTWLPVAVLAAGLCSVVFWPGVVDQYDLDARPVNALPAAGVALAVVLSFAAGLHRERVRVRAAPLALLVLALPWLAADLGFHLDGVPVLRSIFLTGKVVGVRAAVHLGHHHGMDGVLLTLAALLLVPLARRTRAPAHRLLVGAYLGLEIAYGLANTAQDGWLEQVAKRGWTTHVLPSVLRPALTLAWLGIAVAATIFAALILRPVRARRSGPPGPRTPASPRATPRAARGG